MKRPPATASLSAIERLHPLGCALAACQTDLTPLVRTANRHRAEAPPVMSPNGRAPI